MRPPPKHADSECPRFLSRSHPSACVLSDAGRAPGCVRRACSDSCACVYRPTSSQSQAARGIRWEAVSPRRTGHSGDAAAAPAGSARKRGVRLWRGGRRWRRQVSRCDLFALPLGTSTDRLCPLRRFLSRPGRARTTVTQVSGPGVRVVITGSGDPQAGMPGGGFMGGPFGGAAPGGPFGPGLAGLFGGIDGMSYEDLLALQDRLGGVSRGATQDQIEALPTRAFHAGGGGGEGASAAAAGGQAAEQCAVCLSEYEEGENVRTLPCFHTCVRSRSSPRTVSTPARYCL